VESEGRQMKQYSITYGTLKEKTKKSPLKISVTPAIGHRCFTWSLTLGWSDTDPYFFVYCGVAHPDPHYFGKLDPDPHWSEKPDPHLSQN
jgi:hypothetical protein